MRELALRRAIVAGTIAVCVALAAPARAQEDAELAATARARTMFDEGRAAAEIEDWPVAAERFRQALALRDTPPIRYNLGIALIRSGRILEGTEHLQHVVSDPALGIAARDTIAQARARLAHLTVEVEAGGQPFELAIDGVPTPDAVPGAPVPLNPGEHEITATLEGGAVVRAAVSLAEGEHRSVELDARVATAPEPSAPEPPARAPSDVAAIALSVTTVAFAAAAAGLSGWALERRQAADAAAAAYDAIPSAAAWQSLESMADQTVLANGLADAAWTLTAIAGTVTIALWIAWGIDSSDRRATAARPAGIVSW